MKIPGRHADVLVIGGGIIGMLTAIELVRTGARVTVVERGNPCKEASWAGAGILSPIYPWHYPDALGHLVNRSLELYPALIERLREGSGIDPEWRRTGLVIPVFKGAEWEPLGPAASWSRRFGWAMERLSPAAVRAVEPRLAPEVLGGLYWPEVAQIRNPRLTQAAERVARTDGVHIASGEEVTGFERKGERLTGVTTRTGRFSGDRVLMCAGSWSGELLGRIGVELPIAPVKGQILLLKGEPEFLARIVKHDDAYLVPRADGHILVGATMEMAGFDRATTTAALHALSGALLRMTPELAALPMVHHWAGFRPGTPDGLPYLGRVPGFSNFYVASGHYRNGVILAPVTAQVMAQLVNGVTPSLDLAPFAPERARVQDRRTGFPPAARAASSLA